MAKSAPIIGGFNTLNDVQSGNAKSINIMAEKSDGKSAWRLRATPGLRLFATLPTFPYRGAWEAQDRVFVVAGDTFYEVLEDGTYESKGFVGNNNVPVSMDDNGFQLIIVDGVRGYVYNLDDDSFVEIVSEGFYPSSVVAVVDGYAVMIREGTQQFFYSDAYDALSYDPLDFASAETNPDRLVTIISDSSGLIMLGTKSLELYWNSGDANQVFQRRQGSQVRYGCVAKYSAAQVDDGIIWLGRDTNGQGSVYRLAGAIPRKISNVAIDEILQSNPRISEATAFAYQQSGHAFYLLNIPDTDTTYVYDLGTGFWHERRSFNDTMTWGRFKGQVHVLGFGKNLVGDYENGNIYQLDISYYKDNENIVRRERELPPIYDEDTLDLYGFNWFELDCTFGVGDVNPPYDDPKIALQISNDGGSTFGSEHYKAIGKIGDRTTRVRWKRLGTSKDRVFKIVYTYPTPFAINGATVDVGK